MVMIRRLWKLKSIKYSHEHLKYATKTYQIAKTNYSEFEK